MKIALAYGRGTLQVDLPEERTTVIEPAHQPTVAHERASVLAALDEPIGAPPLRSLISPQSEVCIVHTVKINSVCKLNGNYDFFQMFLF